MEIIMDVSFTSTANLDFFPLCFIVREFLAMHYEIAFALSFNV